MSDENVILEDFINSLPENVIIITEDNQYNKENYKSDKYIEQYLSDFVYIGDITSWGEQHIYHAILSKSKIGLSPIVTDKILTIKYLDYNLMIELFSGGIFAVEKFNVHKNLINQLTIARQNNDVDKRNFLSFVLGEFQVLAKNTQVEELDNPTAIKTILSLAATDKKNIQAAKNANREEEISKFNTELEILSSLLPDGVVIPEELSRYETIELAKNVIEELNATTLKDMRNVLARCVELSPGVDNKILGGVVKDLISNK